jgi:hypothetical protein
MSRLRRPDRMHRSSRIRLANASDDQRSVDCAHPNDEANPRCESRMGSSTIDAERRQFCARSAPSSSQGCIRVATPRARGSVRCGVRRRRGSRHCDDHRERPTAQQVLAQQRARDAGRADATAVEKRPAVQRVRVQIGRRRSEVGPHDFYGGSRCTSPIPI